MKQCIGSDQKDSLTAGKESDWVLSEDHIEKFLSGRLLFIPAEIVRAVKGQKWGAEKEETAYLVWMTIYSAMKRDNRSRYVGMHNERLKFGSNSTSIEVRKWLIAQGYLQQPLKNSWVQKGLSKKHPQGYSKQYRAPYRPNPVPVVIQEKAPLYRESKNHDHKDSACEYTRHCMGFLQTDEAILIKGVQQIIADYKKKKEERSRKEEKKGSKRKKKEGIRNAEEALYKLGKPLFELIHNRGIVTRTVPGRGGRLFSPYAFLMREFRPLFTFGGEKMAFIDAVESQPNLLGNLSKDHQLIADTNNREFYDRIADQFELCSELGEIERDQAKEPFCCYAFGRYRPSYFLTQYMATRYPKANEYLNTQKIGNHRKSSWLLQGYESRIFIDGVYRRLREEDILAISIHDGIACPENKGERVKQIVEEEFQKENVSGTVKLDILEPLIVNPSK